MSRDKDDHLRVDLDALARRVIGRLLGTADVKEAEADLDEQIRGLRVAGAYWALTRKQVHGTAKENTSAFSEYREMLNGRHAEEDNPSDPG